MSLISIREAAKRLGLLDKEIDAVMINGIRRAMTKWRKVTIEGIRSKGVGRALWAKKATGLLAIIKRDRVVKDGDGYRGGLKMSGLASMQETGGRTRPHAILPKNAPRLAFMGRDAHLISPKGVRHPGSNIPAMPSAAPAADQVTAFVAGDIQTGLGKAIAKVGLN